VSALLGPAEVRDLADQLGVQPTKRLGQNFVHDANTVRRIVAAAGVPAGATVLEVGPGLGSLTLGLLEAGHPVIAVEIDARLATQLPRTVATLQPDAPLTVVTADALRVDAEAVQARPFSPPTSRQISSRQSGESGPPAAHLKADLAQSDDTAQRSSERRRARLTIFGQSCAPRRAAVARAKAAQHHGDRHDHIGAPPPRLLAAVRVDV